jgi:hypothetical protein
MILCVNSDYFLKQLINQLRFEVLTVASMYNVVLWVVATCSLVEVYLCFRGAYCLHHQGDDSSP